MQVGIDPERGYMVHDAKEEDRRRCMMHGRSPDELDLERYE